MTFQGLQSTSPPTMQMLHAQLNVVVCDVCCLTALHCVNGTHCMTVLRGDSASSELPRFACVSATLLSVSTLVSCQMSNYYNWQRFDNWNCYRVFNSRKEGMKLPVKVNILVRFTFKTSLKHSLNQFVRLLRLFIHLKLLVVVAGTNQTATLCFRQQRQCRRQQQHVLQKFWIMRFSRINLV